MTDLQANEIIEKTLQSHWPTWLFPPEETKVWMMELRKYDYIRAKSAIDNFYMATTKQGKPAPGALISELRAKAVARQDRGLAVRLVSLFGIYRDDGRSLACNRPLRWSKFVGDPDMPRPEVEAIALKFCRYANSIEAGHYIKYCSTEEPKGYSGEEGCTIDQRRKQAFDKACVDILNGPDSKTKRWLAKYLNAKHEAEDKAKAKVPVKIGEAARI